MNFCKELTCSIFSLSSSFSFYSHALCKPFLGAIQGVWHTLWGTIPRQPYPKRIFMVGRDFANKMLLPQIYVAASNQYSKWNLAFIILIWYEIHPEHDLRRVLCSLTKMLFTFPSITAVELILVQVSSQIWIKYLTHHYHSFFFSIKWPEYGCNDAINTPVTVNKNHLFCSHLWREHVPVNTDFSSVKQVSEFWSPDL